MHEYLIEFTTTDDRESGVRTRRAGSVDQAVSELRSYLLRFENKKIIITRVQMIDPLQARIVVLSDVDIEILNSPTSADPRYFEGAHELAT